MLRQRVRVDDRSGEKLLAERKARAEAAFAPAVAELSAAERKTLSRLLKRMTEAVRTNAN